MPSLVSVWADQSIHGNNAHGFAWQEDPFLQNLWDKGGPNGLYISADVNINVTTPTASVHAFLPNPQSFHIIAIRGPALEVRIDGATTTGTTSTSNLDFTGTDLWMGAEGGANNSAEVDYLQFIAFKGKVSDGQIAALELYLKNKYGF
jgi:hypothetical protein